MSTGLIQHWKIIRKKTDFFLPSLMKNAERSLLFCLIKLCFLFFNIFSEIKDVTKVKMFTYVILSATNKDT
jgi:hypothetical protein